MEPVQISDYGAAYQEFSFSGEPQYSREASTSQGWSHPAHTGHTNEVSLPLVNTGHVTWIRSSHWSILSEFDHRAFPVDAPVHVC